MDYSFKNVFLRCISYFTIESLGLVQRIKQEIYTWKDVESLYNKRKKYVIKTKKLKKK